MAALTSAARAACTPTADNTPLPAPGAIVTCSGNTVQQNGNDGYGTGTQSGITINVDPGASVTGNDAASGVEINIGSGAVTNNAGSTVQGAFGVQIISGGGTLTNQGTIRGNTQIGIVVNGDATVINAATGDIAGVGPAINISGSATVTNSGSISSSAANAINVNGTATVTNNSGGTIAGFGFGIESAGIASVTNSGIIRGQTKSGIVSLNANLNVTNNAGGSIEGAEYALGASALNSGGSTVFNAGTITGGIFGAIIFAGAGNTLTLAPGSSITGVVAGGSGNTLQLDGAGAASFDMSGVGAAAQYRDFITLNKVGASIWTLTGTSSFTGATNITGGTLRAGSAGALSASSAFLVSATLDLNGFNNSVGSLRGSGIVTNNGAVAAVLSVGSDNTSRTFSGNLQDGSAALGFAKTGTGTLTLSGINTYSGGTTLNASTILVRNNNVFGTGLLAVDGTTLQGNVGSLYNLSNAVALGAGGVVLDARAGILGLSGSIADGAVPGGAFRITDTTIQHGGTVILTGNNTYTGSTTIDAGANALAGSTTAFSAASDFVVNGALVLAGRSNTIRSLSGSGEVSDALGAPATLTIAPSGATSSFSGQLINGPAGQLSLTKAGAGTQILEGLNTYTGATTVNGGTLTVNGSIASSSLTTVNAGGTLGGNGIVGDDADRWRHAGAGQFHRPADGAGQSRA